MGKVATLAIAMKFVTGEDARFQEHVKVLTRHGSA